MTGEESVEKAFVKVALDDLRHIFPPPNWLVRPVVESDASELACIAKDEGATRLDEDEMIVFGGCIFARLDSNRPGHSKMDAEPVVVGEFEEHAFSASY